MTGIRNRPEDYARPIRRILVGALALCLLAMFALWRIDGPRAERVRANLIDSIVPSMEWALVPVARTAAMIRDFQSYVRIYEQNKELRRELRQMQAWKEAALQLEQQNAKLLKLNNVRLDPKLTFVTGRVLADSGSPFRRSALLNVGGRDGIVDGWATTDGLGLVGRISGVGNSTSRVILLTDTHSRVPVTIQPSGRRAILTGDNSAMPLLGFLEDAEHVRPGDRVVSSGDGGVFPAGIPVGQVAQDADGKLRARLLADFPRIEYLRILRSPPMDQIVDPGRLVTPSVPADSRSAENPFDG